MALDKTLTVEHVGTLLLAYEVDYEGTEAEADPAGCWK
jgi:hypothetical protein